MNRTQSDTNTWTRPVDGGANYDDMRPYDGPTVTTAAVSRTSVSRTAVTILAAALTLFTLLNVISAARAQDAGAGPASITVAGTGVAYGAPDMAVVELGVSVYGADVRSALADADARMNAVREALLAAGVAQEDVRTAGLNVWRDERTNQDGEITVDRYQVNHSYQVRVLDVDTVGEVLAAAVDAGANAIGGISFTIADPDALASEARALAMADAAAKAGQLAELAGVTLGAVTAIEENGSGSSGAYPSAARFQAAAMSSVEGGQLAVSVTITVSYSAE